MPKGFKPGPARLAVSFHGMPTMLKGFVIAVLLLLGASQLDQYFCNGKHTDGAMAMLRQIRHSFRV
jgi:hypothetical protein